MHLESNPDRWLRLKYHAEYYKTRDLIARYVGADPEDVVLIENASSGVNAVLRSQKFEKGDKILYLSFEYGKNEWEKRVMLKG